MSRSIIKARKRNFQLGDVIDALDEDNDAFLEEYFEAGHIPEKAPKWQGCIMDMEKLQGKYNLWKIGLLKDILD